MSLTETIALGLLGALAALGLIRLFSVPLRLALRLFSNSDHPAELRFELLQDVFDPPLLLRDFFFSV